MSPEEMLREFQLLVASRSGEFQPPAEFQHRVHPLALRGGHDLVSSTDVRERIARGEPWEHLVPVAITAQLRKIYAG